jgi:hypothetical protein
MSRWTLSSHLRLQCPNKKGVAAAFAGSATTPQGSERLVVRGTFDMTASVLYILAEAADGAATGACESEDGGGEDEEREALMGCFHGDVSGFVGAMLGGLE